MIDSFLKPFIWLEYSKAWKSVQIIDIRIFKQDKWVLFMSIS